MEPYQPPLCDGCQSLTLDNLMNGHMFYPDILLLFEEIGRENACSLCSLVWCSLGFDKLFSNSLKYGAVYLYLNPPPSHTYAEFQCIDVIVTELDVSQFTWCPRRDGELWHLGPPDFKDGIYRGRLTVYSNCSKCVLCKSLGIHLTQFRRGWEFQTSSTLHKF